MNKNESNPEVARISGEKLINLRINPDATESAQMLHGQQQANNDSQIGTMLKIDSMQQINDHTRIDPNEDARLSQNDQMALRASPPASMVDIPGKLGQEQSKVSIAPGGNHGFLHQPSDDNLQVQAAQDNVVGQVDINSNEKENIVDSIEREKENGQIFQNNQNGDDQMQDDEGSMDKNEEKGDHTANRYREDSGDYQ